MKARHIFAWFVRLLVIAALVSTSTFGSVTAQPNSVSGTAQAQQTYIAPQRVQGQMSPTLPPLSQADIQRLEAAQARTHLPGPTTQVGSSPLLPAPAETAPQQAPSQSTRQTGAQGAGPLATPSDLLLYRNVDLGATGGAPCPATGIVNEPSTASNQDIVFYTYNWGAAISSSDGALYGCMNPFTFFPPSHGGFCCDQSVIYEPTRDVMFWLLQYIPDSTGNILRLAVAKGRTNLVGGAWCTYDIPPAAFTYPGKATGDQFDYPQLAFSSNNGYITVNIFSSVGVWQATLIMRVSLDSLAACAPVTPSYLPWNANFTFTPTQGAGTTIYWASHNSTSQLRVFRWDEGSTTIFFDDVNHTSYPFVFPYSCPGPSTISWCGRSDDRVMTGWVGNGVIGFMWNASQGTAGFGTFAYPYVHVVQLVQSTRVLINEPILFASNLAWIYPAVGVDARGHIAGSVFYGGGTFFPSCAAIISDDLSTVPPPWTNLAVRGSTNDPTTSDLWGDYVSSHPDSTPFVSPGHQWNASCYTLQGGGAGVNVRPQYVRLGRRRDRQDTAGLYNPTTSVFYQRNSNTTGVADVAFGYGPAGGGWMPLAGDWTGQGFKTVGLYNPVTSTFYLRNSNTGGVADLTFAYGPAGAGWIPIVGDWNGTGSDKVGLYNPLTSTFYLRNSNTSGPADVTFSYGPANAGWIPIVGDWNGTGSDKIGLYNPATSTFFLRNSNTSGVADLAFNYGPGGLGWVPVTGNYNYNLTGQKTIGLYNPSTGTYYLRYTNTGGVADATFNFGPGGLGWFSMTRNYNGH